MKKILLILGVFLLLVGCQNKENNNDSIVSNESKTVIYTLNNTNEDIDMYSKEDIKIPIVNTVKIEYTSNIVLKIIEKVESDYSEATDKYVNESYEQNKTNFVEDYNKHKGFNMNIEQKDKSILINGEYDLASVNSSEVKNYLELSFGLDPENYNEDGTYPLDDLEKALEEKGFTKEA